MLYFRKVFTTNFATCSERYCPQSCKQCALHICFEGQIIILCPLAKFVANTMFCATASFSGKIKTLKDMEKI